MEQKILVTRSSMPPLEEYVNEIKKQGVMDAAADRYHVADQMALNNQIFCGESEEIMGNVRVRKMLKHCLCINHA